QLASFTIAPPTVNGGATATGTITLATPAPSPAGTTVFLTSFDPNVSVPLQVTIPANQRSATFPITTLPVTDRVTATIEADLNGDSLQATLNVVPSTLV